LNIGSINERNAIVNELMTEEEDESTSTAYSEQLFIVVD
jgi:hypothetical protein